MAILAPLQEGMQALPSDEVANAGARALSKINLVQGQAERPVPGSTEAMGSIQEAHRRQTSASRTPTRHGCSTTLSSPWKPDDLRKALERGLFCPLDDPTTFRRSMSPTSRCSRTWTLRTENLWAMKRHQGELRMFGGVWKKQRSSGALTSSLSSRRRSSWPWSAGLTHARVSRTTSTQSSTRAWRSGLR